MNVNMSKIKVGSKVTLRSGQIMEVRTIERTGYHSSQPYEVGFTSRIQGMHTSIIWYYTDNGWFSRNQAGDWAEIVKINSMAISKSDKPNGFKVLESKHA